MSHRHHHRQVVSVLPLLPIMIVVTMRRTRRCFQLYPLLRASMGLTRVEDVLTSTNTAIATVAASTGAAPDAKADSVPRRLTDEADRRYR